jgi:dephospho-CoA kinase
MLVIGLTGGIGSGKSTVSSILKELGISIVDADVISKEVVNTNTDCLKELTDYFGTGILDESGALNRKSLADIVFNNSDKLDILNKITHKYIIEELIKKVELGKVKKEAKAVVIDAPIPVKHGFLDLVDEVWSIIADDKIRAERVKQRNGVSSEKAYERIHSQKSNSFYKEIADEVIENNAGIAELRENILKLCKNKGIG